MLLKLAPEKIYLSRSVVRLGFLLSLLSATLWSALAQAGR